MTDLIAELSKVKLPKSLVDSVDVAEIMRNFGQKYKALGNFQEIRAKHEKRNFLSRWLNSGELREAELDALELQADFARTLGQLIILNTAQAKRLEEQQLLLSQQQEGIQVQTEELLRVTSELELQGAQLKQQAAEQERLVKEFIEVRGFTQEGAKKLIEHAHKIEATKQQLEDSFNESLQSMNSRMNEVESSTQHLVVDLFQRIESERTDFSTQIQQSTSKADDAIQRLGEATEGALHELGVKLTDALSQQQQQHTKLLFTVWTLFSVNIMFAIILWFR